MFVRAMYTWANWKHLEDLVGSERVVNVDVTPDGRGDCVVIDENGNEVTYV
jgi:hypothetical protein